MGSCPWASSRPRPGSGTHPILHSLIDRFLLHRIQQANAALGKLPECQWTDGHPHQPQHFDIELPLSPRGEYELTDAIRELAQSGKKVQALVLTGEWADVRDPEILARLNK